MEPLRRLPSFPGRRGPLVLCIMDGVGYGKYPEGDAVRVACKPQLDWLHATCPHLRLKAHGTAVGLPSDDDMGNSEVGHNAIGCGRVYVQGARLVNDAIASRHLFAGQVWRDLVANCLTHHSTLHFLGLFSDGNVHSHLDHLKALIQEAKRAGLREVRIHVLLDGRDVGETSALEYVDPFEEYLKQLNTDGFHACIASGGGRMKITMDRYGANWNMVRLGWEIHVHGQGRQFATAHEAIATLRQERHCIDQDLPGWVIAKAGQPVGPVMDDDALIMYNFRGDRAIEISNAFDLDNFSQFDRGRRPRVQYAGMMQYDGDTSCPHHFLVNPPKIERTVGAFVAHAGLRQLAISETQKYGHVTYFYNGNLSGKFVEELEDYVCIESDRVPFEERPWMKSADITDRLVEAIGADRYRFIRLNYPNGDMVGHTGIFQAVISGVEAVDLGLRRLLPAVKAAGGIMLVTADHGNADDMFERDKQGQVKLGEDGRPKAKTAHSLNPVPCLIYDPEFAGEYRLTERTDLGISSLGATCLNLLGFAAPDDYDPSLVTFS